MGGFFGPKWFKFTKNWAEICAKLGQPGRFFAKNHLWTYLASPLDAPGAKTPIFSLFFTIFATGMGVGTPGLATLGPARGKVSALPPQTTLQLCSQAASCQAAAWKTPPPCWDSFTHRVSVGPHPPPPSPPWQQVVLQWPRAFLHKAGGTKQAEDGQPNWTEMLWGRVFRKTSGNRI